ncbi:hypothetical protein BRADI_4g37535v3 [Brachypodium distachyon]|uniref:Uncharacterized protein n=1 Tax=Brachypodium distachyon TaxID=15368 RepID=A0A2K2CSV6_BRADI|nr:hypothetical protein BRADI_4g37535v3 [Brachypodium distachyon]
MGRQDMEHATGEEATSGWAKARTQSHTDQQLAQLSSARSTESVHPPALIIPSRLLDFAVVYQQQFCTACCSLSDHCRLSHMT